MPTLVSNANLSAQKRDIAVRLLESRACFNLQHVAAQLRISERTLQRWIADDKDFAAKIADAQEVARRTAADAVENTVLKSALDGDTRAGIFMLQAHKPDRYRPDAKGLTNNGTVINIGSITVVPREAPAELPAIKIKPAE